MVAHSIVYHAVTDGASIEIDPGYGSCFDIDGTANWYAVICDDCLYKKRKLIKKFEHLEGWKVEEVPLDMDTEWYLNPKRTS